jgi:large subunit ribosomal protein L1
MASKRYRSSEKLVEKKKVYALEDAISVIHKFKRAKFDETVELAFKLGVDPRKSDQMVRGTVGLPHGSGKKITVLVFAKSGPSADAATEAGADYVGFEDMVQKCRDGWTDFDVAIATPEAMTEVRKLGRVLGPRGLMPNPKTGTVTDDTAKAVEEVKAGRVEYKVDKGANIHVPIGKISFSHEKISVNANSVIEAIRKARPKSAKGTYILSCHITTSMGPSVKLDLKSIRN